MLARRCFRIWLPPAHVGARLRSSWSNNGVVGMASQDYSTWNAEQLLARVQVLENDLKVANEKYCSLVGSQEDVLAESVPLHKHARELDPSRYATRKIALKFAYLGRNYNGLEYAAGNITTQQTIEEVLWAALRKARLIFPSDEQAIPAGQISWAGCDYSKCGRTDKGVSAFGQVVGLRVRSNRPILSKHKDKAVDGEQDGRDLEEGPLSYDSNDVDSGFDPIRDELPYVQILNRLLPSDVRVLAWCSDLPQDFSARFSCRERRYRYFFTNPAFPPSIESVNLAASKKINGSSGSSRQVGWLDIQAMQDAAKRYEGLHDFRNLCKIDASKQITDFRRRIFHSEIRELDPLQQPAAYIAGQTFSGSGTLAYIHDIDSSKTVSGPKIYEFVLHGSAFLWHQVRHMVAILFYVGQGLETPDIVDKLLDVHNCPQKPHYDMADDAPLVLWDCIFPDLDSEDRQDSLNWLYVEDESSPEGNIAKSKYSASWFVDNLWETWRKHKIDEILAGSLLNLVASQGHGEEPSVPRKSGGNKLFLGGNSALYKGPYVPLMQRKRLEHVEVQNAKYAAKKGLVMKSEEELQQLRNTRRDKRQDHVEVDRME